MQNAQMQLQAISESINRARERRLLIERQIADVRPRRARRHAAGHHAGWTGGAAASPTAGQIEALQTQLKLQRLRYTADHPDIRTLERTIRDLQAKLDEEAKQPPRRDPEEPPSPARTGRDRSDCATCRRSWRSSTTSLPPSQAEEARLKKTMADYQAKIEVVPSRESDLVELTRDYSTLQTAYASLLTKREDSKIAANLERRQIGEQFRIIDPAVAARKAVQPGAATGRDRLGRHRGPRARASAGRLAGIPRFHA